MKILFIFFLFTTIFLVSCSKVRQSAGVNRKNIDEFRVIENPPLIIPPDFNLLPPEQLSEKNIDNIESDLAKEILFGLDDNNGNIKIDVSTMENILNKTNANEVDGNIRQEINELFSSEKYNDSKSWDNEIEIIDAISESQRLRNERLGKENLTNETTKTLKIKNKKKKRFIFF